MKDVRLLLEGRNKELADMLADRMSEASANLRYEMPLSTAICARQLSSSPNSRRWQQLLNATLIACLLSRREAAGVATLHHARRQYRGRREFFWEDIEDDFNPASFLSDVLAHITRATTCRERLRAGRFRGPRAVGKSSERAQRTPRQNLAFPRGEKRDMIDWVRRMRSSPSNNAFACSVQT